MNDTKIKLPIDKDGEPDYDFMEQYIKSLSFSGNIDNQNNNIVKEHFRV